MTRIACLFIAIIVLFAGCSEKIAPDATSTEVSSEAAPPDASLQFPKPYHPSVRKVNDITHTKLELAFSYKKKEVYGKATLTVKPYFHDVKELTLDAKGFDIKQVAMVEGEEMTVVPTKYDSLKLTITLDRTYTSDESYQVYINYVAHPHDVIDPYNNQGLFFVDVKNEGQPDSYQIWTQGESELNSSWFPTNDTPNEKFTQEIYLTVDNKFKTLSNGLLVLSADNGDGTRTDYWKQSLPHSAYLAVVVVGDYKIVKDEWRGIEVSYYVEPPYEKYARDIFGNTPKMIEFFSNKLGYVYPWEKYSQIMIREFDLAGAMENTTAVTFQSTFQLTRRELLDGDDESTIAHELFHHWFGDLTTTESWPNLPLNEAFATYGTYLWFEFDRGLYAADQHLNGNLRGYLRSSRNLKHDLIWYDVPFRDDMFDSHSYSKGGRILHMLRNYLGDKLFFKSLSNFLKQHEYKAVEAHDLRLTFEETSGEDLNWFFNQWFFGKGHPELKITYSYDAEAKKQCVNIDQQQDLEINGLYRLPIQIDIYHGGRVDSFQVVINNAHETFFFDIPSKPDLVKVD
ncbi:MAG: M1 family metallopeptidase, partial [Bacteroidetes bacterium]|nr:M1 family metallopeptidase [Bacteroidota bacterium]